jgi:hypothetical protein
MKFVEEAFEYAYTNPPTTLDISELQAIELITKKRIQKMIDDEALMLQC